MKNIKKFLCTSLNWCKIFGVCIVFGLFCYLSPDICYADGIEGNNLSKTEVKVNGNNYTLSINNSTFNIFDSVLSRLTDVRYGVTIPVVTSAGFSYSHVKNSELSPIEMIGVVATSAIISGSAAAVVYLVKSIFKNKIGSSAADLAKSNITTSILSYFKYCNVFIKY